jgi:leukotriene-A4 hydrolase
VAIAVGELESREVSPRCRVWSEPSMVDAAAFEFSQTEDFLQVKSTI